MCRGEVHPSPAPPLATATHAICARPHPAPTGCGCRLGPSPHHGDTRRLIAALSGVLPEVVTLALDGWPPRGHRRTDEAAVISAYERWTAGEPLPAVAQTLGITPTRLRHDLATGSAALPPRLSTADTSRRFGWDPSTGYRSYQVGLLPAPDGREGTRPWWWEHTIEGWAAHRDMHPLPCLRGHLPDVHRIARPPDPGAPRLVTAPITRARELVRLPLGSR